MCITTGFWLVFDQSLPYDASLRPSDFIFSSAALKQLAKQTSHLRRIRCSSYLADNHWCFVHNFFLKALYDESLLTESIAYHHCSSHLLHFYIRL